jgi:hypothetical protein
VTCEARFNAIRAKALETRAALDVMRGTLRVKYGDERWASPVEKLRLCAAQERYDRAADRMFALLAKAERDWTTGVPSAWVVCELPFRDAFAPVAETLTAEPPKAFGY